MGREVPSVTPPQASSAPRFTLITWLPPSVSALCHVARLLDWGGLLLSEKVRIIKDKCPHSPPLRPLPPRDEGDKRGSRSSSSAHVQELNGITSHLNNKDPKTNQKLIIPFVSLSLSPPSVFLSFCVLNLQTQSVFFSVVSRSCQTSLSGSWMINEDLHTHKKIIQGRWC